MIAHRDTNGDNTTGEAGGLLLVNIGNSRISVARFLDGQRSAAEHLDCSTLDATLQRIAALWRELPTDRQRAMVVCSVNPPVLEQLKSLCQETNIAPVLVVGENIDLPIGADLPEPNKVGADRMCSAAAAYAKLEKACVVADFGTALTVDLVSDNNVFLGGTILPGMKLSARALHEHTALLPLVEVGPVTETLGKNTASAIRNGIFAMMVGALREITERYATEIGKWPPLIVTGGDATVISSACDFVDHNIPDLCLDGLVIAYQRSVADTHQGHEAD